MHRGLALLRSFCWLQGKNYPTHLASFLATHISTFKHSIKDYSDET